MPYCARTTSDYPETPGTPGTNASQKLMDLADDPVDAPLVICPGTHRIGALPNGGGTIVTLGTSRAQTIEMMPGARFLLDAGITLVIRARFIADPRQQVFRGAGATAPFLIPADSTVRFGVDAVDEISPCWWGADPLGTVDSAGAGNLAHAAAEAIVDDPASLVLAETALQEYRRGPVVRYPAGTYRVQSSLLVNRVLRIRGDGPNATVFRAAGTTAVFKVQLSGVQVPYHTVELRDLGMAGYEGSPATQHGVHVVHTGAQTPFDTTCILDNVHIQRMGGHGFFNVDRGNTTRIRDCFIQGCWGSGIKLTGEFNTDCHIRGNVIRANRIGVEFAGTGAGASVSGFVTNNIIEGNNNGTGALGSATRPSMGISMHRTWNVYVAFNYFEFQLADIHSAGYVSNCVFENNFHDSGANNLPQAYAGTGGAQRRLAAVYFAGEVNTGNTLRSNALYKPQRPAGTTTADWGFAQDTWEHLPVLSGCSNLVLDDNKWLNPATGGQQDIAYAPSAAGNVQFRSALATAGPPAGTYTRGAFIRNALPTVLGSAGSRYTVTGWTRLTDGSGNSLGTDWVEVRAPTGT
jgi:hypothetical protein